MTISSERGVSTSSFPNGTFYDLWFLNSYKRQEGILQNEKDISIKYYWIADVQIINIKDYSYRNVKPFN